MTRILIWNINNFSRNKIFNDSTVQTLADSQDREAHIVNQVMGPANPDIFVILEAYSRTREVGQTGTVISDSWPVGFGLLLLLDQIRTVHGNTWCLVPPLNVGEFGFREAVAVFYNAANLQFIGPYLYAMQPNYLVLGRPRGLVANVAALRNYPSDWWDCLPSPINPLPALQLNRTSTVTIAGMAQNVPEWQFAGQWSYTYNAAPLYFPYNYNRSPFLTSFVDLTSASQRVINLFSIHTSPGTAVAAVQNLALAPEIANCPGNNVNVVAGDFNVDTFDANNNAAYNGLDANYEMLLDPRDATNNINANRQPYCNTHVLPLNVATPFNNTGGVTDPQHNVYPRYGYMGSMGGYAFQTPVNSGSIDNIFRWYGGGLGAVNPSNITIANTIVGTPYNQVMPAPGGVTAELTGGLPYATSLANAIPQPVGEPPPPAGTAAVALANLQLWANYGRVRSTSDHLAVIADV